MSVSLKKISGKGWILVAGWRSLLVVCLAGLVGAGCTVQGEETFPELYQLRADVFVDGDVGPGVNWNGSFLYGKLLPAVSNPDDLAASNPRENLDWWSQTGDYSNVVICGLSPQGELTTILYLKDIPAGTYDLHAFVDLEQRNLHVDHDDSRDCFCHRHGVPAECLDSAGDPDFEPLDGHQDHDPDLHRDHDSDSGGGEDQDGKCDTHGGVVTFSPLDGRTLTSAELDQLDRNNESDDCYCQTHSKRAYCSLNSTFNLNQEAHQDHDVAPNHEDGWCDSHGRPVLPHGDHDDDNSFTVAREDEDGYCRAHQTATLVEGNTVEHNDHDTTTDGFCFRHGHDWNTIVDPDTGVVGYNTLDEQADEDSELTNDGWCDSCVAHTDHDSDDPATSGVAENRDGVCREHSQRFVYNHPDHDSDNPSTTGTDESADQYCETHNHAVLPHTDDHDGAADDYCEDHGVATGDFYVPQPVHRLEAVKLANASDKDGSIPRPDAGDPVYGLPSVEFSSAMEFVNNSRQFRTGSRRLSRGWGASQFPNSFPDDQTSCTFVSATDGTEVTIDWEEEGYNLAAGHDPCDPCDVEHDGQIGSLEDCDLSLYSHVRAWREDLGENFDYPLETQPYRDVNGFLLKDSHRNVVHLDDDYDLDDFIDDGTRLSSLNDFERGRDPKDGDGDGWDEWFSFLPPAGGAN